MPSIRRSRGPGWPGAAAVARQLVPATAWLLGACTLAGTLPTDRHARQVPGRADDPAMRRACEAMAGALPASASTPSGDGATGGATGGATIETARWFPASPVATIQQARTPAAGIQPALPAHCELVGSIAPADPHAPPIRFQLNLPDQWNGRGLQYGGSGFNGPLVTGLALPPAARFDEPGPLARGFATWGTDSGHGVTPGTSPQAFALNDEALRNFAHASYRKVYDVALALIERRYGRRPDRLYFIGSSEGGREGLMFAQRHPDAFDGIVVRVPVVQWTGLHHAALRNGQALRGDGYLGPRAVALVAGAVRRVCDGVDGLEDGIVSYPEQCRARFDPGELACRPGGADVPDGCLNPAQIRAIRILHSPYVFDRPLAHGTRLYPAMTPGPPARGGWTTWWTGEEPPADPPTARNGMGWVHGNGAIRHFFARDSGADLARYHPRHRDDRIQAVSSWMDATDPDLSAFDRRGGKLIVVEHLSDYAQSPFAGIAYVRSVASRLGQARTDRFVRLYTAPGVDHVGSGAPANVDLLEPLVQWVERASEPGPMTLVRQEDRPPFAVLDSRPLCRWPRLVTYRAGPTAQASSFECVVPRRMPRRRSSDSVE